MKRKKGQVWIETVIYTLIAFVMIGTVLAFVKPKIEEFQDKAIIERSVAILEEIDKVINSIGIPGNKRELELGINKGILKIDGENDLIVFEMDSTYEYSEIGKNVYEGDRIIRTEEFGKANKINITIMYPDYNITFQGKDESKSISKSPTSYKLFIANKGNDVIDISLG